MPTEGESLGLRAPVKLSGIRDRWGMNEALSLQESFTRGEPQMPHIAVIGAGITGVTTAYALAEQGFRVTVVDRGRYPAMDTSFANGGQLSACNAEVWNSWSTVLKGLRWMFRPDAPLLINPWPSWHKYSWFAEFVANIPHYERNTLKTVDLAIRGREYMFEVARRENIQFDHERRGILHIYHTPEEFREAEAVNRILIRGGLDRRAVTPDEIRSIEPTLPAGRIYGGFFTPSDSTGDIHKFTVGLAEACKRRNVRFIQEAEVETVSHRHDRVELRYRPVEGAEGKAETLEADGLVICAGIASRHFAKMLGDRANIYPVKGYSITVYLDDDTSKAAAPWVSLLDESTKIVTSRFGADRLRVAGTAEFNGENRDIRADRIRPLVQWVETLFPDVNTERTVPWAGLRPMMPNMLPLVGPGSKPGVFYNTGHGHLGWTLSAATAQIIAARIAADLRPGLAEAA